MKVKNFHFVFFNLVYTKVTVLLGYFILIALNQILYWKLISIYTVLCDRFLFFVGGRGKKISFLAS